VINLKITRLKLVNFIGIKHGMDKDEIEIKFKNRKIVMLNGGNGSGKTTIMSQLHPFKDSYDDRKVVIIEGTDGIKEIDIENDGNCYEIKHIYGKGAKSFIKKNGAEMNENGGVKTFNTFIENEFHLTPDYFKIGKIGSNTQNFIQFTTAERKIYISKFLPDIGDYLDKFEIIRKKFLSLNENIKAVSNDLGKLEDEVALKVKIQGFESLIVSLDGQIETVSGNIAVLSSQIKEYEEFVSLINLPVLLIEKNNKEIKINEFMQSGQLFVNNYGKKDIETLEKIIIEKRNLAKKLGEEIAVITSKKQAALVYILSIENEVKKIKFNLLEIESRESLLSLETKIGDLKKSLNELKLLNQESFANTIRPNYKDIPLQLSKFESFKNFILSNFNIFREKSINPAKMNIDLFLEDNFDILLENQVSAIRSLISGKQNNISMTANLLSQKESDYMKFSKFYGSGIEGFNFIEICNECPLAKDAIQYQNLPAEITLLKDKLEQMKKDLKEFENKSENLADIKNIYKSFKTYFEQMNPRTNQIYSKFLNMSGGSLSGTIFGSINTFSKLGEDLVDLVNTTIYNIQDMHVKETELQNLEYKLDLIRNNEKIKEHLLSTISEKTKEIENIHNIELPKIELDISSKSLELEREEKILKDHQGFLEGKRNIKELISEVQEFAKQEKEYIEKNLSIKNKKAELVLENATISELKARRVDINSELLKSKTTLNLVENLKKRKMELDMDFKNQKLIKDSLDPNKGIPLYFIKAYLEKTKDITNNLLNLAFDGGFEINFLTSASDFFIQVRAGENIKNDIKEASQGELALTTISISLALIEQSIGKYNILALDEIDGPLDGNNRQNFITILNKQIEKLGIAQIFVISHNDAFDTEEMDLILLKDNNIGQKGEDFMKNKEIIFEI